MERIIAQIQWNLFEKSSSLHPVPSTEVNGKQSLSDDRDQASTKSDEHIMISYNSASRELCLNIKTKLENFGYRVWIDVVNMHGSSIDAMAQAVENSMCVLMCVTEKYRQSNPCQCEAKYAFNLKKNIIPLIMQKGYGQMKGWLGFIMGDKIFVDFSKYEFEVCIKKLKNELDALLCNTEKTSAATLTYAQIAITPAPNSDLVHTKLAKNLSPINNVAKAWTENEVSAWFIENALNNSIFAFLRPCTGAILFQMFKMRNDAPEFYFQTLKSIYDLKFSDLLLFTSCLENLFTISKNL